MLTADLGKVEKEVNFPSFLGNESTTRSGRNTSCYKEALRPGLLPPRNPSPQGKDSAHL